MSPITDQNKTLVRRFFTAIEQGDFPEFDEIVAVDYDDHLVGQSRGCFGA
jgi:ketosteroid isomerase-like protein